MKRKYYTYKNFTIILSTTHDEDTGLKYIDILPSLCLYAVNNGNGISFSWLIFEMIIHRESIRL